MTGNDRIWEDLYMARGRRITLAALNIALHAPHPQERYIELLQRSFRRRSVVRLGSLHGVMLGTLTRPQLHGKASLLAGEIYRFVKLDPSEPWFNAEKKEPATDEEVEAISIPSHLLPHLQRIPFAFNARTHTLWYVSRDQKNALGPAAASKFLLELLRSTALQIDFPEVEVTPVPESTSVDKILAMPSLEYLRIELVRPNPDHGSGAEARWLKRLEDQRTTKAKLELFHSKNTTLQPDDETREMAQAAAKNGSVYGRGRTADGLPIEDSTSSRPMLRHENVDSDVETAGHVLERAALE